jgi:hypothetical protein
VLLPDGRYQPPSPNAPSLGSLIGDLRCLPTLGNCTDLAFD